MQNEEMSRISSLINYLYDTLNTLTESSDYQINADMLGDIGDYSLDKIPTDSIITPWIMGVELHQDVFSFKSRKAYSQDIINNLENIGFFEKFENLIETNNKRHIWPEIKGIESIHCLNTGTLKSVDGTEAIFDIQIQIQYRTIKY